MNNDHSFEKLAQNIQKIHDLTAGTAKSAVNQMLTIRNWIIGLHIVEFEQNGDDRAQYGERLLDNLSEKLCIKGLGRVQLNLCRIFYQKYPQLSTAVSRKLNRLPQACNEMKAINAAVPSGNAIVSAICSTPSNKSEKPFELDPELLLAKLSFSHIREIMTIDDPFERFFYELECIKGTWSVRELKRQIDTKLYFRAGVSNKPELLLEKIPSAGVEAALPVKSPYVLEFLGLNAKDEVSETDVEQAIMDHLQDFLLEMGKGFCFEARQKRILIDDEYYFIDLVFYNRLLHCNVIIELKTDKFRYEYFGQLNSYVAYYKDCEMAEGDNPPIGILLCTEKGPKMVEYVLAGMDNNLFVSTYMLQLPDKKQLEKFLLNEVKEMGL